jgi:hypothetical protein
MFRKTSFSISCAPMRPVSGFERPVVQWIFVALGVVLIAVVAAEAVALRRGRAQMESVRAARLDDRVQRDQLENRLAHERATREALTLELARVRGGASPAATQPTLTLTPLTRRGAQPPEATVAEPSPAQSIQLRLALPPGRVAPATRYTIAVRTWSGGEMLWHRSGLAGATVDGKPMVTTFVTGDVFAVGAYEVLLTSSGEKSVEIASYEIAVHPN